MEKHFVLWYLSFSFRYKLRWSYGTKTWCLSIPFLIYPANGNPSVIWRKIRQRTLHSESRDEEIMAQEKCCLELCPRQSVCRFRHKSNSHGILSIKTIICNSLNFWKRFLLTNANKIPPRQTCQRNVGSGSIKLQAWLDRISYIPGDIVFVHGLVDNASEKTVNGIKIQLLQVSPSKKI